MMVSGSFRLSSLACACIASLLSAAVAMAATDRPIIWSWLPPGGGAANHRSFRALLVLHTVENEPGTVFAQRLAAKIRQGQLTGDRIGVVMSHYGRTMPTLAYDPADAVAVPLDLQSIANGTPWLANGLPKARSWTDSFIAEYQRIQALEDLPSPSRFHMDCELRLPRLCYQDTHFADCWSDRPVRLFDAIVSDPRWASETVPVAQSGGVVWRTVQQLHQDAGAPSWDSSQPRHAQANRAWSRWYDAMQRSVMDGALEQAFYAPVRAAWPLCRSSEFAQSIRVDGAEEPNGRRVFRDFEWWLNGWMDSAWHGVGDLQAPTIYAFGTSFMEPGSDWTDANIRLDRANLDACLHSFGGAAPETITPWIMLPGTMLPIDTTTAREADAAMLEERLAILRWRGMSEFQLWPGASPAIWTHAARTVDAVWSSELVEVQLFQGSDPSGTLATVLGRADRQDCEVFAAPEGIEVRIRVQGEAGAAGPCARDRLLVHLEGGGPTGSVAVDVALAADPSLGWIRLGSVDIATGGVTALHRWWMDDAGAYVGADGSVLLRAVVEGASYRFDLFNAVRLPSSGTDLDGSGAVDTGDLAMALLEFGPTSGGNADIDGQGSVDFGDIALILLDFGVCDG